VPAEEAARVAVPAAHVKRRAEDDRAVVVEPAQVGGEPELDLRAPLDEDGRDLGGDLLGRAVLRGERDQDRLAQCSGVPSTESKRTQCVQASARSLIVRP
jgi:hypothetical protein